MPSSAHNAPSEVSQSHLPTNPRHTPGAGESVLYAVCARAGGRCRDHADAVIIGSGTLEENTLWHTEYGLDH